MSAEPTAPVARPEIAAIERDARHALSVNAGAYGLPQATLDLITRLRQQDALLTEAETALRDVLDLVAELDALDDFAAINARDLLARIEKAKEKTR